VRCASLVFLIFALAAVFVFQSDDNLTMHKAIALPPRPLVRIALAMFNGIKRFMERIVPAELVLMMKVTAFWQNQAIGAVTLLGVPDVIPLTKPQNNWPSVEDIANELNLPDSDSLYRIMRALASENIFKEHPERRFSHTRSSVFLRKDHPSASARDMVIAWTLEQYQGYSGVYHQLKTGENAFYSIYGTDMWTHLNKPENGEHLHYFQRMFDAISEIMTPPLVLDFDWSKFSHGGKPVTFVDVGGGYGGVLYLILLDIPEANGVLFDQEEVIAQAKKSKRWGGTEGNEEDLSARTKLVSGSFLESVPEGGDVYFLRMIIHDWNDTLAVSILSNIRKAFEKSGKNGTVIIIDQVLEPEGEGHSGNLPISVEQSDIHMMLMLGAKERTLLEFQELCTKSGLTFTKETKTRGTFSLIECVLS